MRPRLYYTPEARGDFLAIVAWYTQAGAGRLARSKLARIASVIGRLADNPARWPVAPNGLRRVMTVAGHRVIYRLGGDGEGMVVVLRLFGPGQEQQ